MRFLLYGFHLHGVGGEMKTRRAFLTSKKIGSIFILIACVGVGSAVYVIRAEQGRREALFDGSCEVVDPGTPGYYASLEYDLRDYADYGHVSFFTRPGDDPLGQEDQRTDDPAWVDGAARWRLQASMRKAAAEGGTEGNPVALYLYSPTVYREQKPAARLRIAYPPDGAVFPPNLCEPRVDWEDPVCDLWQVTVGVTGTSLEWRAITEERSWRFPSDIWEIVRQEGAQRTAWIQVKGVARERESGERLGGVMGSQKVHFRISSWPVDDVIVYRMVVPPFNKRKTPDTFARSVSSFEERPFLLAHDQYCYNCHTFSAKTGTSGKLSVQARYMRPGAKLPVYLGVYDIDQQRGWKAKLPFDIQMSTFMSWSADGRWLAFSANQQLVTFEPIVFETQFAGEPTSDLAIYDAVDNITYVLPGGDDPERLEMLPCWSLDGQWLVFCSGPAGLHPAQTRYDLCEIPFNGGKGGEVRPIPGASGNGRSNFYPHFSPDGKWLSFVQADAGILIKASSDIYLMPADLRGTPHRLEANAVGVADSWHSWSSNSRWLVFASKREDGIFARLYMTEIDDQGHSSPAVRLPLREEPFASFNIPEFVAQWPQVDESELFEVVRVEAPAREVEMHAGMDR